LEQAKVMPIPMTNYSFGGGGESLSSSDFQGKVTRFNPGNAHA
jgi:hypothetical protein